jgi:hypothetical protein
MISSMHHAIRARSVRRFEAIKSKIANSLVGSAVGVQAGANAILHGKVMAVQIEEGEPKLLVAGTSYDLDQVLTVMPERFVD